MDEEYDVNGLPGSVVEPIPDVQVLVRFYWDEEGQSWLVNLLTEGLEPGGENAQAEEILINAVSLLRSGDISLESDD